MRQVSEPASPVLGSDGGPEQAGFPELGPEMAREYVVTVDGRGVRRNLGLGEGPYGVSKPGKSAMWGLFVATLT